LSWRASPEVDASGRWDRLPLDLSVLRPESINTLAVSPTRVVWLGTDDGAAVYNGGWQRLTTSNGLADNQVTDLLMGTDGSVWLATAGGLSRFTPKSNLPTGSAP
jgi:ligand-binding sensor domain-containing protein